ncbi:Rv0361 family membrane protein [Agrococcus sediminis]|uniref:Rv0361 family membrane protein n=1 Tax=Agrococcus sediminis TaxID=2599924 RepID=UPI0034300BC1
MASAPQFHMPDEAEPPREGGVRRSHIAVALVALLVGVGATLGVQALAAQSGPRSEQAVRDAVLGYLGAIAAGDDDTADAALLGSAQRASAQPSSIAADGRLRSPRITEVVLGDGTARVDVSYAVADRTILSRIEAVFADGAWRMQRTLGEPVPISSALSVPVQVDAIGVVPATRSLLLLPGRHTIAPIETALVTMPGSTVDVDGDPRTQSAIDLEPTLTAAALSQLAATGSGFAAACSADRSCNLPAGFDASTLPDPIVVPWSGQAGEVAVRVPIASGDVGTALEVVGRMSPDLSTFEGMRCALAGEEPRPCGP